VGQSATDEARQAVYGSELLSVRQRKSLDVFLSVRYTQSILKKRAVSAVNEAPSVLQDEEDLIRQAVAALGRRTSARKKQTSAESRRDEVSSAALSLCSLVAKKRELIGLPEPDPNVDYAPDYIGTEQSCCPERPDGRRASRPPMAWTWWH
jgi:hypothetical protein